MELDTTDYSYKAPYLNDVERDLPQITVDEYYFNELVKIKKYTNRYLQIFNSPFDKTSDELMEMFKLKKQIEKLI